MPLARAIRLGFSAALLLVAPAAARADGVHTDPNSPTSKEYAIPLDSARHAAASGGGGGSVASQTSSSSTSGTTTTTPAPLFGVGVKPTARAAERTSRPRERHRSHHHKSSSAKGITPTGNASPPSPPPHLANAANTPGGGITTPVLIGGLAALALVIGGIGGLALRRRLA